MVSVETLRQEMKRKERVDGKQFRVIIEPYANNNLMRLNNNLMVQLQSFFLNLWPLSI